MNCFLYGYTFIDPVVDANVEEAVLFYIIPLISYRHIGPAVHANTDEFLM